MLIETLTTFPRMYDSIMGSSMMKIAQEKNILEFRTYDLRDWTHDRHRTTDDHPYGGGPGLVMKCEPIFEAWQEISQQDAANPPFTIFLSPCGQVFDDKLADELVQKERLLFVCGHYEGIDERAYSLADQVISLGDYVLTSGELASMVVIDAVVRKLDGVLGNLESSEDESFRKGLLEHPHYTRPAVYRDMKVPDVLLSGNHADINEWRHRQSLLKTLRYRPDLLEKYELHENDYTFLNSLSSDLDMPE